MKNQIAENIGETPLLMLSKVLLVRLQSLLSGVRSGDMNEQLLDLKKLEKLHDRLEDSYQSYLTKIPELQRETQKLQREKAQAILKIHEKFNMLRAGLRKRQEDKKAYGAKLRSTLEHSKQQESIRVRKVYDARIMQVSHDLEAISQELFRAYEAANAAYEMLYVLLLDAINKDEADILNLSFDELGKTQAKVVFKIR